MRAMKLALSTVNGPVSYINTHGTSTPVGDIVELNAIKTAFSERDQDLPHISATKSMTGHSLGAAGVQEAIYSLLMMEHNFVAPSINIEEMDEGAKDFPIATKTIENVKHSTILSNSFGFGGTNCTLAMSKFED